MCSRSTATEPPASFVSVLCRAGERLCSALASPRCKLRMHVGAGSGIGAV